MANTCFSPYEQFLTLESIENCRQNLNLSPRTNPVKAITRIPSNVYHISTRYLVELRHHDPIEASNIARRVPLLVLVIQVLSDNDMMRSKHQFSLWNSAIDLKTSELFWKRFPNFYFQLDYRVSKYVPRYFKSTITGWPSDVGGQHCPCRVLVFVFVRIFRNIVSAVCLLSGFCLSRFCPEFWEKRCPFSVCPAGQGRDRVVRTSVVLVRRRLVTVAQCYLVVPNWYSPVIDNQEKSFRFLYLSFDNKS